ncbi:ice-binding family protein [Rathayibacter soli]|uniref:ice-binding family protein n=1 Tax=Rathayibacter soli TaxID=3144168 RepID=UPI0027E466DC|nr:ice-binding family protein [Glaciibacter superstes]
MAIGFAFVPGSARPALAAEAAVGLGTAESFAVLGGTTVTNTGVSDLSGDLGVSPGSAVTGFPPGIVENGVIHTTDGVADTAQQDVTTAYNDAAGRSATALASVDLAGQTLGPGVYSAPTLSLSGTLTLDGDASSVFIFQAGSTLITGTSSHVMLTGGASQCNVFWQVGSSATLGTGSVFVGTVLALTSITANTTADVQGRLLARNGAVTLDTNTVTRPANCTTGSGGGTTTAGTTTAGTTTAGTTTAGTTTAGTTTAGTTTAGTTTAGTTTAGTTTAGTTTAGTTTAGTTTAGTTTAGTTTAGTTTAGTTTGTTVGTTVGTTSAGTTTAGSSSAVTMTAGAMTASGLADTGLDNVWLVPAVLLFLGLGGGLFLVGRARKVR